MSGQQIQAEYLTKKTKWKLSEFAVGDNVIAPIPQYDHAPIDPRNILGVIVEYGDFGYRTEILTGYLSRNQIEAVKDTSLFAAMVPELQLFLRDSLKKLSKTGGQGFLSCKCKGGCSTSKYKLKSKRCCVIPDAIIHSYAQINGTELCLHFANGVYCVVIE